MAWFYINQKGHYPQGNWLNQVSPLKRPEAVEGFQIKAIQCSRHVCVLSGLEEANRPTVNCQWWWPRGKAQRMASKNGEWFLANNKQENWDLSPIHTRNWTLSATSKFRRALWTSDEIVAPANIMHSAWWDPGQRSQLFYTQTPGSPKLWENKFVLS